jgi:glucose-1-phosphate thymidylyltransferase
MKGVILAGGHGTRLREFTKILNKGLAPIYCPEGAVPQLVFPLKTLVNSGIKDIMIITSRDHCGKIVELFGDGTDYGCTLTYRIQEMSRPIVGIAQALGLAKDFVGNSNFAVILGDNYYEDNFGEAFKRFDESKTGAGIFLKRVPDPERFGVAEIGVEADGTKYVKAIVEKPKQPVSDFAVTGLYLYRPEVFKLLPSLVPSARKELEITDINNYYVQNKNVVAFSLKNFWHDMGLPESAKEVIDFLWSKNGKV